jgi:hypothetical protein
LLALCLNANSVSAQDEYEEEDEGERAKFHAFACADCRNAFYYYVDFGNFAFNALMGADPWIGGADGARTDGWFVDVMNLQGQIVQVDVSFFSSIGLTFPSSTLEITVVLPNGVVRSYEVLASSVGSDLPVGGYDIFSSPGSGSAIRYGTLGTNAYYSTGTTIFQSARVSRKSGIVTCDPACY